MNPDFCRGHQGRKAQRKESPHGEWSLTTVMDVPRTQKLNQKQMTVPVFHTRHAVLQMSLWVV
jgi:hypothetical protein